MCQRCQGGYKEGAHSASAAAAAAVAAVLEMWEVPLLPGIAREWARQSPSAASLCGATRTRTAVRFPPVTPSLPMTEAHAEECCLKSLPLLFWVLL